MAAAAPRPPAPPPPSGGPPPAPTMAEPLNQAVVQQLNLESVKTRALGLFKAISRILEEFDHVARTNSSPKWSEVLGQFSMVNMELFSIVEDIKKISKAFVVHPKNVNAENANILPVMISSKLLPEMEAEDNSKKEQILLGLQNLPVPTQIEKLKERIDMINAACENAENFFADAKKGYGFGSSRQGSTNLPTLDKAQAAKILEQESLLRAAVNHGEGLQISGHRLPPTSLPPHLVDVLIIADGSQNFGDSTGAYLNQKSTLPSMIQNTQGSVMQTAGSQLMSRSVPSPSGVSGTNNFENTTSPPLSYANSPRSGTNMMNTPSPLQHAQQQQQRQKVVQLPQHQQLAQQHLRQVSAASGGLSQLQGQHQMQYSQFQNRQLQSGSIQHNTGQSQLNQGSQMRSHLNQFMGTANNAMFNSAQTSPSSQMLPNMSTTMASQTLVPRMQFGVAGGHTQRNHPSQMIPDQMFNMGSGNATSMMQMQQQQHGTQGGFANISNTTQNLQPGMVGLHNNPQNPNYPQQRQQNQP